MSKSWDYGLYTCFATRKSDQNQIVYYVDDVHTAQMLLHRVCSNASVWKIAAEKCY